MDAKQGRWSELPVELVAKIQARLPVVSLVRSRVVCKAWNAAVDSSDFLQERRESGAGTREWMLFLAGFCKSDKALASTAYDPASNRWYKLQLPSWLRALPNRASLRAMSFEELERRGISTVELLAPSSAGGSVLLEHVQWQAEQRPVIFPQLGNPLARFWASLPAFSDGLNADDVRGLFVDAEARCFKLVAVLDLDMIQEWRPHGPVRTFVFDSALGSWSVATHVMHPCASFHFMAGQGVFVGTVLYCLTQEGSLMAYDLERASWSKLLLDRSECIINIFYCTLVHVRDRLLCVALFRDLWDSRLQIWEVDFEAMAWTVVEEMPDAMFTHFRGKGLFRNSTGFDYKSALELKVVAGPDEVYIAQEKLGKIVAYDLRQSPAAWRWLPSLPFQDLVSKSLHCFDPWLQFGSWKQG